MALFIDLTTNFSFSCNFNIKDQWSFIVITRIVKHLKNTIKIKRSERSYIILCFCDRSFKDRDILMIILKF